jgi:PAS domain S-box-containing protein/putative nucleotidyltransferase with HDIG domain
MSAERTSAPARTADLRGSGTPRPTSAPLRVLIVEDQPDHAELMALGLRHAGFAPQWQRVETEAEYLAHLTPLPDLILSDYALPEFGAARALELLKDRGLDIPFIVVSATIGEETAVALMKSGATDYLLKDRLTRLGHAVGRALEQQRLRREKHLAENELRASAERYRSLFEGVPVGLYRSTAAGEFLDANPAFLRMLGYPDLETLKSEGAVGLYVDPDLRRRWVAQLERTDAAAEVESRLRRHDGALIWVRASARLVRDAAGQPLYVEGATVDITERKRGKEELRQRAAELEVFYEVGRKLREAQKAEDMYPILVEHSMRILRAEYGMLALLDADHQTFTRLCTLGLIDEGPGSTFPVAGSPTGQVVETGTPYVVAELGKEQRPLWLQAPRYQMLGPLVIVPVRSEQEIVGTLGISRAKGPTCVAFTDAEVRLLEGIAEIGGTAIRGARLHESLEQAYIQMVLSLARTVDARDSYTGSHSEQLAISAEAVAKRLRCGEGEIQDIRWAALLHDIGKIGVPDEILRKPGALTDDEWTIMREHPTVGEEILLPVDRMKAVAKLVRHHQEHWDGTGYPDGLRGEQIPLGARILAVVDTYGAMVDDRTYRRGRPHQEVIAELRRCAGSQFDPRVVETFFQVLESHAHPG